MDACSKQRLRYQSDCMSFICMHVGEHFLLPISSSSARAVARAAEFLMAITQCAQVLLNPLINEAQNFLPVQYRFEGCCLHKWKSKSPELTRAQRSLAQHWWAHGIMRAALSPGLGWFGMHSLQCRLASSLWAGWDLCRSLFGSPLRYLKKTASPFNCLWQMFHESYF